MDKNQELYKKLREQYTDEELAEAFVFPNDHTPEEETEARRQMAEFRKNRLMEMTGEEKVFSSLMRIKYQMQHYVRTPGYDGTRKFANFLEDYLIAVNRKQKEFAEDIDIHPARLSRILNDKEKIGKSLAYRLEKHSGELIPAILWWKLAQKEVEHEIQTDSVNREKEGKKVKNIVFLKNGSGK
ncbi:MAG TPA: helix-turn-helix domain-containing protein [Flavilitoribacter sp.]|nr:helix-turn-helix domain-containing protein [Flavilitoribacter sp.]HMQ90394.1 helix-turn-helix domain-containing protein [Flavilitoribacter sp.]